MPSTAATPAGIGAPVPILRSLDEGAAREFYLDYLGFEIEWEHRFEPGLPLYLRLHRDGARLDLSEHHGDGMGAAAVWIPLADVYALHAELRAKSYPRARPGVDPTAPGGPTLQVIDPFNNQLRFCSPGD